MSADSSKKALKKKESSTRSSKGHSIVPLPRALAWIIGSTLVISGSTYCILKEVLHRQWQKTYAPENQVAIIVQTGPQKEALKTVYLAELMGLALDAPKSAYRFNTQEAEKKLLASPVIKKAHVKVQLPDTIYVDYTARQPIAWLCDYENTALDNEGYPFPVNPFFSPKTLPEIYLGQAAFPNGSLDWHKKLEGEHLQLAFTVLNLLTESASGELFKVRRIDVSRAFSESYGSREIVVVVEDEMHKKIGEKEHAVILPRFLRLSTKNYAQELGNYLKLREKILHQEESKWSDEWSRAQGIAGVETTPSKAPPKVIDLRLPKLAFIDDKGGS